MNRMLTQLPPVLRPLHAVLAFISCIAIGACSDGTRPTEDFTVTPDTASIFVGGTRQFTAVGAPGIVEWTSSNQSVATVVPQTGSATALARGTSQITATSSTTAASATLTVLAPPSLSVSTPVLEFEQIAGAADPAAQMVTITNAGDLTISNLVVGPISYGSGEPSGWLTATPSGGTTPVTVTLQPTGAGLRGTYTAVVPFFADGIANSPQHVAVTFRVRAPADIEVSRTTVPMSGIRGATLTETVAVTNSGDLPLTGLGASVTYGAGQPQGWLTATLGSGSAPATLTLVAGTAPLAPGSYSATVRLTSSVAGVAPVDITVPLTVAPGPAILLSASTVDAATAYGTNAGSRTVTVTNSGGGTLSGLTLGNVTYGAGQPTGWLDGSLNATTAPATITLAFATASLASGDYTATLPVQSSVASNSPVNIVISLSVGPAPDPAGIAVTRTTVPMSGIPGAALNETVGITNSGDLPLTGLSAAVTYGAGEPQGWLTATLGSTTAPTTLTLVGNTMSLSEGSYNATVRLTSTVAGVAPVDITVPLTVTTGPAIQLSSSTVNVTATYQTNAAPSTVAVTNSGGGSLSDLSLGNVTYGAGQPTGWLDGSIDATTAPATITLAFTTAALASGSYTATLPVQSSVASNSPVDLVINLTVGPAPAPAGIDVSRTSVPMSGIPGVTLNETVEVTNSGEVPLTGLSAAVTYGTGQTQGWLTATLSSTTAPATLTLVGNTTSLAVGSYNATVRVSSTVAGVAPVDIVVPLTVTPGPAIALSSSTLSVTATYATNAASQAVTVTNGGGGTLSALTLGTITYGGGQPTGWLGGSLNTNTAPATITLTFATAALLSGSYTATLPVQSSVASNSPVNLVVNLTVGPAPVISVNPGSVTFATWGGAGLPASQGVQITNTGGGTLSGLSASIGSYVGGSPGWLTATFSGGTTAPTTLLLRPNTTALTAGTRTAVVTLSSTVPGVATRTVNVTYTVQTFTTNLFNQFFTTTGCSGCHSTTRAPVISSTTTASQYYSRLVPTYVIAGNASGSPLVCRLFSANAACPHGKYTTTTGFQAAVTAWINAGAPFQ